MCKGFADYCLTFEDTVVKNERLPSSRLSTSFQHAITVSLKFIPEARESIVTLLTFPRE